MKILNLVFLLLLLAGCKRSTSSNEGTAPETSSPEWTSLFNGNDLEGWTPKIKGESPGSDSLNTFIADSGYIRVSYRNYGNFDNRFGHLFYEEPFTSYFLSLEYRFKGEQVKGGESWAYKNSGVMFHSQSPNSMLDHQNFPVSLEGQFLGGSGQDQRPTMNLCTPGTHVMMGDSLVTQHCITANAPTFRGEEWIKAGFLVLKDSLIIHYVNGKEVMRYSRPQLGGQMAEDADEAFQQEGLPLTSGYIALQSESHPIDFRNIYLADLSPYLKGSGKLQGIIDTLSNGPTAR